MCAYLEKPHTRLADLYPLIAKAAKELTPNVAVPECLLKLARIPKFDYFVSLTFDSLMARARYGALRGPGRNARGCIFDQPVDRSARRGAAPASRRHSGRLQPFRTREQLGGLRDSR